MIEDPLTGGVSGPGVDRAGNPVRDPTDNVLDLVRAAMLRQDDLRIAESRHIRELLKQRDTYEDKITGIMSSLGNKLREREAERLDAIRSVDRDAVTRAAEVSAAQATALAADVTRTAEAMRTQVEAQRVTTAEAQSSALAPINQRLDSILTTLASQAGEKTAKTEDKADTKSSTTTIIALIGLGVSVLVAFISIVVGLYLGTRKPDTPPTVGTAVACSAPGILPGQVCTTNAPR